MIKLIFSTSRSSVSRLIRFATWGTFSHVDFIIPEDRFESLDISGLNDFSRSKGLVVGATIRKGVVLRTMVDVIKNSNKFALVEVDATDASLDFALSQLGKKYDYKALLGFPFRKNLEEDDRWYCSELVYRALLVGGVRLYKESIDFVSPRDIYEHPVCKLKEIHYVD